MMEDGKMDDHGGEIFLQLINFPHLDTFLHSMVELLKIFFGERWDGFGHVKSGWSRVTRGGGCVVHRGLLLKKVFEGA